MLRFSTRLTCSAISAILAAGIVAFADPANAVPTSANTENLAQLCQHRTLIVHAAPLRAAVDIANG